jgi:MFS family permease
MEKDKNLWVLVLVCVINSLGFGIIVPVLYSYGKQYGVTGQTLGILTASFSVAQFFATPVLGSLSDKYGRKPLTHHQPGRYLPVVPVVRIGK